MRNAPLFAFLIAALILTIPPHQSSAAALVLKGEVGISAPAGIPGPVKLAMADLARDLQTVLGTKATIALADDPAPAPPASIAIKIDPALKAPESYSVVIAQSGVTIAGADALGAIYGIYAFSHRALGVDPYVFWKNLHPPRRESLQLQPTTINSTPATFRYRGWFINDEDLLTEWKPGSGPRFISYPYYHTVISLDIADRIFETCLRAGGNLIIPASFVDVMNEPEANLVRRAAARGLYVTQHHIEPMGMSFFGFENYWKNKGETVSLAYGKDPGRVHQTWRAYARKWREVAGDQVIWQIGLRGRGDRPLWTSDKSVTEAQAGDTISRAMAEQVRIVREVDPRPQAPITTTLWHEMSQLMNRKLLSIPPGVTIVFCDEGSTQLLQADFDTTPRTKDRAYGAYLHLAFWKNGPHLALGTRPQRLKSQFDRMIARGDTHYAILNVCNIREHLLGVEAGMSIMRNHAAWDYESFITAWAPHAPVRKGYEKYLASLIESGDIIVQDGHSYTIGEALLTAHAKKTRPAAMPFLPAGKAGAEKLAAAIKSLDELARDFDAMVRDLPDDQQRFYRSNLLVQARNMRGLYRWVESLDLAFDDPSKFAEAQKALEEVIEQRKAAEEGHWQGWYTGDKKANTPRLLERTRSLAQSKAK